MKDRIRQIMESQHMTQQVFAEFIGVGSATLSSIFNDRTRPTLNIVEAIKKKIPNISTDWLMFGSGDMYLSENPTPNAGSESGFQGSDNRQMGYSPMLDFNEISSTNLSTFPSVLIAFITNTINVITSIINSI